MFQCYSLNSSHPLLPPLCPQVCFLHLYLYCCLTNRFIRIIFLNSIYMHWYMIFVFPLLDFILYDRLMVWFLFLINCFCFIICYFRDILLLFQLWQISLSSHFAQFSLYGIRWNSYLLWYYRGVFIYVGMWEHSLLNGLCASSAFGEKAGLDMNTNHVFP